MSTKQEGISPTPEVLIPFIHTASKYKLKLLTLLEYQGGDTLLSIKLADEFSQVTTIGNGLGCRLQVSDGYTSEKKPHYQLDITWGNNSTDLIKKFDLHAPYFATANGKSFNGLIKVGISLPTIYTGYSPDFLDLLRYDLTSWAFKKYKELMEQIYPEWKTTYNESGIQFIGCSGRQDLSIF